MGARFSDVFPTSTITCNRDDIQDARFDYACSSSAVVRTGLTLLHFLITLVFAALALVLFCIFNNIRNRKMQNRLFSIAGKRMPSALDGKGGTKQMRKATIGGLVTHVLSNDVVPQPVGRGNAIDGAVAYGTKTRLHAYAVGIASDLLTFARDAIGQYYSRLAAAKAAEAAAAAAAARRTAEGKHRRGKHSRPSRKSSSAEEAGDEEEEHEGEVVSDTGSDDESLSDADDGEEAGSTRGRSEDDDDDGIGHDGHNHALSSSSSSSVPLPSSLRDAGPLLVETFNVDALDLALVINVAERAQVLGAAAEPTAEEFGEFKERVMRIIRQVEDTLASLHPQQH